MTDQQKMKVLGEQIVPPAGYFAGEIRKGQVLRIIDIEGQQVADLVTISAGNIAEKLSVMNTISLNKQVFPRVGYVLYSDEARGMMTIIADTCGVHDMLAGACSRFTNEKRYGVEDTKNCRDNLAAALKPWGITWKDDRQRWQLVDPGAEKQGRRLHRLPRRDGCDRRLFELPAGVQCLQRLPPQALEGRRLRIQPLLILAVDARLPKLKEQLTVTSIGPRFAYPRTRWPSALARNHTAAIACTSSR